MHGSFHLRKSGWRVPKLKAQHSESNSNTVIQDSESDSNSSCDPEVSIENSVWDIKSCMYLHQCVLHVKEVKWEALFYHQQHWWKSEKREN